MPGSTPDRSWGTTAERARRPACQSAPACATGRSAGRHLQPGRPTAGGASPRPAVSAVLQHACHGQVLGHKCGARICTLRVDRAAAPARSRPPLADLPQTAATAAADRPRQGGFRALISRLVSCNSTLLVLVSSVPADVRVRPGSALHCETGPAGRRTASNEWGTGRVARACLRGSWFGRNWNLFHSMSQGPNSFTLLRGRGSESAGTIPQLTPSAAEISDAAPSLKSEASPQLTPSGRCCSSAQP